MRTSSGENAFSVSTSTEYSPVPDLMMSKPVSSGTKSHAASSSRYPEETIAATESKAAFGSTVPLSFTEALIRRNVSPECSPRRRAVSSPMTAAFVPLLKLPISPSVTRKNEAKDLFSVKISGRTARTCTPMRNEDEAARAALPASGYAFVTPSTVLRRDAKSSSEAASETAGIPFSRTASMWELERPMMRSVIP